MKTAYRQILVHYDNTAGSAARLALARRIAQEHGGAVAALHAVQPLMLALPYAAEAAAATASRLKEEDDRRRAEARAAFDQAVDGGPGPRATWAESGDTPAIASFSQQALYADLVLLGQHERGDPGALDVPPDFVDLVIAGSGKPALVLPYAGSVPKAFATVAIAWKATPESAAAVSAAMPLLQRAGKVVVMAWSEGGEAPAARGSTLNLDQYLRLHGIQAQFDREAPAGGGVVGDLILSRCADHGADLLVMGLYGHSRAREWILGGASRTVLRSMTLPVLMAH